MKKLELKDNSTALCIVAHPDDETIWMGGTMARYKNLDWTIFVLCRESDPDRMPKFKRVAKDYFGAEGIICDLEDDGIMKARESVPEIKKIIKKRLKKRKFDYIFTHASWGEYGHVRHKGVHQGVKELLREGIINAPEIFYFSYKLDEEKKIAVPKEGSPIQLEISAKELQAKRNVIKEWYGFRPSSFENRSCNKI